MKWSLRFLAGFIWLTIALLSVSRRQNSGWIVFTGNLNERARTYVMTGDGSSVVTPANAQAILQRGEPFDANAPYLRAARDEILIIAGDGSSAQRVPLDTPLPYINQLVWSPDGEWIAFLSGEPAGEYIYRVRPDGRDLQRLTRRSSDLISLRWSPDGDWLLITRVHQRFADIVRVRADGSSLEILAPGVYPDYAAQPGLAWRPLWVTFVAAGIMLVSLMRRFLL